jgi:hypothetical protein
MKIDLNKGTYIDIGGELGKYHSIPIDVLVKLAQNFQKLINTIAEFDLPSDSPIDLSNFKIELVDFKKASAAPKFAFSSRIENKTGMNWQEHRNLVNNKFDNLINISNTGDYSALKALYPEPIKRNPIVENLYEFINDFGTAPVSFGDYNYEDNKIIPFYKIHKFKPSVKKDLIVEMIKNEDEKTESDEVVGKIKIIKKGNKIIKTRVLNYYIKKNISLTFSPDYIAYENRKYSLNFPLHCLFEKEDDYFIIQSDMLGIIGTGKTEDEAEYNFSEEFDYIYQKYNSLNDSQLTKKLISTKIMLNQLVNKVEI